MISWPLCGRRARRWAPCEISGGRLRQVSHANQIVSRRREGEHPSDAIFAAILGLAESSDGLDPPEDLLDPLPFSLTDGVARVLRGSLIDGAAAPFVPVLRYVRSHRRFPELVHKISRVVVLVSAQRHPPRAAWNPRRHLQRGIALGRSRGPREPRVHHQPVAVFHQYVTQIAELGFRSPRLLVQHCFRIAGRLMRLIAALFAVKVHRRVAAAIFRRWWRRVFTLKTLLSRPRFDQRSIHGEVLI